MQTQHLGTRPGPEGNQHHMTALETWATYNHRPSGHPTEAPPRCKPGSGKEANKDRYDGYLWPCPRNTLERLCRIADPAEYC